MRDWWYGAPYIDGLSEATLGVEATLDDAIGAWAPTADGLTESRRTHPRRQVARSHRGRPGRA